MLKSWKTSPFCLMGISLLSLAGCFSMDGISSQKAIQLANNLKEKNQMKDKMAWTEDWDDSIGLWRRRESGHTDQTSALTAVHPGPDSASKLLLAAQLGQLDQVKPGRVLAALRAMQTNDHGELHGCLKWYWEESKPIDTNAAFFTALGLIPLRVCYYDKLDVESQRLLDEILGNLRIWFANQTQHRSFYYPNKFLGDLVCAWLLDELSGRNSPELSMIMHEAADYWRENHWGWGEHMSGMYSGVCLDELSLLLLMSRQLPEDLRRKYQALFCDILAIDDAFGNGPRVPAIRSYDFLVTPHHQSYRSRIRPLDSPPPLAKVRNMPFLKPLFQKWGWEKIAPRELSQTLGSYGVPCYDGATANAWIAPDFRAGCMSRYPIMPNTDHAPWGLSWQSMPVAFWSSEGDWGYWQWETSEAGIVRSHPSPDRKTGKALSSTMNPSPVGKTFSLMKNGNMLFLRVMPVIPTSWERLTDRLRIVDPHAAIEQKIPVNGWSQLVMRLPERTIAAQCLPLTGRVFGKTSATVLVEKNNPAKLLDWELDLTKSDLNGLEMAVTLWGLSIDGEVVEAPILVPARKSACLPRMPEQSAWELTWLWPGVEWHVTLDPLNGKMGIINK